MTAEPITSAVISALHRESLTWETNSHEQGWNPRAAEVVDELCASHELLRSRLQALEAENAELDRKLRIDGRVHARIANVVAEARKVAWHHPALVDALIALDEFSTEPVVEGVSSATLSPENTNR